MLMYLISSTYEQQTQQRSQDRACGKQVGGDSNEVNGRGIILLVIEQVCGKCMSII